MRKKEEKEKRRRDMRKRRRGRMENAWSGYFGNPFKSRNQRKVLSIYTYLSFFVSHSFFLSDVPGESDAVRIGDTTRLLRRRKEKRKE